MLQRCRRASALLRPAFFQSGCEMSGTSYAAVGVYNRDTKSLELHNYGSCGSIRPRYMHQVGARDRGMLGTTVLCVRKDDKVIVIGDGQVTLGAEIIKPNVRKVRRIGDSVIGGFAAARRPWSLFFSTMHRFPSKRVDEDEALKSQVQQQIHSLSLKGLRASLRSTLDRYHIVSQTAHVFSINVTPLTRAAVELAKAWRSDKYLRRLDAVMVVADAEISLTITGNGDVLEPYDGVIGIGSGGSYASAAARALIDLPNMDAETIALKSMKIAADCCIYTNHNFTIQRLDTAPRSPEVESEAASISNDMPPPEGSALKQ